MLADDETLVGAELAEDDHDDYTAEAAEVAVDAKQSVGLDGKDTIIDDLHHDLAAIDAKSWSTVRSFAYFQMMGVRAQLVIQLAELEAKQ